MAGRPDTRLVLLPVLILDLYSRNIAAWQVHEYECADYAAALATEACLVEGVGRDAVLVLHAGNGGPMKGASMLATLQWLGVVPSFSRPRVSDDNPFPEALFRTLKYRPDYPERAFADIDAARAWIEQFVHWYNHDHRHSGIRFVTPQQRHAGLDRNILPCIRKRVVATLNAGAERLATGHRSIPFS